MNLLMLFGEETQVSGSCSVTYRNRFYVFGGWNQKRQISEVAQCELKRIGTLGFDHDEAACSNVDDREIYLCFDWNNRKQCRSAVDPLGNFTEIPLSTYSHESTSTAASPSKSLINFIVLIFSAELLAVGGDSKVKTEMYLTEVGRWYTLEDYPYDRNHIIIFVSFLKLYF